MKKLFCCAIAGLSLAAGAQTVALTPTSHGGYTGSFVQEADGSFFDTFTFTPASVVGEIRVSLTDVQGPINFFTALLKGQGFAFLPESGSSTFAFATSVTSDQPLQLQVSGFAGDATTLTAMEATYGGSFVISAIPEPAPVALLLVGLGLVGGLGLRRSKS